MIRLLVVDDQELVRAGLRLILSGDDDLEIVGEASDSRAGVEEAAALRPDVVLMDVRMPVLDGIAATRQIVNGGGDDGEHCRVLALTTSDDDDVLWGAIEAGVAGFVLEDAPPTTWSPPSVSPLEAAPGSTPASPEGCSSRCATHRPPRDPTHPRSSSSPSASSRSCALSPKGANNAEIAATLYLSERTVKGHVSAIFIKRSGEIGDPPLIIGRPDLPEQLEIELAGAEDAEP